MTIKKEDLKVGMVLEISGIKDCWFIIKVSSLSDSVIGVRFLDGTASEYNLEDVLFRQSSPENLGFFLSGRAFE